MSKPPPKPTTSWSSKPATAPPLPSKTVYDEKALTLLIDHRERSQELFEVLVADDNARGFLFDKMRDAFMRRVIATDSTAGNPRAGD